MRKLAIVKATLYQWLGLFLLSNLGRKVQGEEIGKAFQCEAKTRDGVCAEVLNDTVYLNPGMGTSGQECFFSGNETGQGAPVIGKQSFPTFFKL